MLIQDFLFYNLFQENQRLQLKNSNKCLDHDSNEHKLLVSECDNERGTQQFQLNPPEEIQPKEKAAR